MPDTAIPLITQQRTQLEAWRAEAIETGGFIANDVCDGLERELEELTRDGLLWDFDDSLKSSLLMTLAMGVDDACETWITQRIETLSDAMQAVAGNNWNFNTARSSLDNLRKGLRIRQRMAPRFDQLFEKAKPGMLSLISRALTDDIDYVLNGMDKDADKDGARLRSVFQGARADISLEISQLAADLLRRAIHGYQVALADAENRLHTGRAMVNQD
jgi:hypothetical protein